MGGSGGLPPGLLIRGREAPDLFPFPGVARYHPTNLRRPETARPVELPSPPPTSSSFRVRPFQPAWWLPGAHLQTVVGRFLRPAPDPGLRRERLDTPDGDFLLLDVGPEPAPDAPTALVLHGLEGSSDRSYARVALAGLHRRGIRPVGLNFRSCGGEMNRTARAYHSGETDDLAFVVEHLLERFPGRPLGLVGFSLGGNILLKYLGEREAGVPSEVAAAASISVPFDLVEGSRALEFGAMGKVYTYYFLRQLRRKAASKAALLESLVDLEEVLAARTIRAYDEAHTARIHGFEHAMDYYRRCSSLAFLPGIRVPTLLLQSRDDPFLPDGLPRQEVEGNPSLIPGFTPVGGHVGFVEGEHPAAASFWAEEEATRFLAHELFR